MAWAILALSIPASLLAAPVEIAAPPNGSTIKGDGVEINISINATDRMPVSRVEVSLDGSVVTSRTYSPPTTGGNSVFKWDTTRTPNGRHTLAVGVFSGGNVVGNATCEVIVSNLKSSGSSTAPRVSIKSPKDGQVVSGTTPIIVESTDPSGSDPFVSIYVDKVIRSAGNVKPYRYDWDTTKAGNGPHYISARSVNDGDDKAETPTIRVIVRNQVVQVPISMQSNAKLPLLSDLRASSVASSAGRNSAAPSASVRRVTEAARSDSSTSAEKFEVNQAQAQKANVASASQTSPSLSSMPAAQIPSAQVSVPASVQAEPVGNGTASELSLSPSLASNFADPSELKTSASTGNILSAPAAKLYAQLPSNGTLSTAAEIPALAAKSEIAGAATTAKSTSVLSVPALPSIPVELPSGTASSLPENPTLASAGSSLAATSAQAECSLLTPSIAQPKTAAAEISIPAGTAATSSPVTTPILMAKADTDEIASTVAKNNVLSAPKSPKAKPVVKKTAPAAKPAASAVSMTHTVTVTTHPAPYVVKPVAAKSFNPVSTKMVRIRPVIENAGGTIQWDRKSKTVHAVANKKKVTIKIGSSSAKVNDENVEMEREAIVHQSRTIVPETFVNKTFGKPMYFFGKPISFGKTK
jgi:hypothetical protein